MLSIVPICILWRVLIMQIKFNTPEEKAAFQRLLFEILLALAKGIRSEDKDQTYLRAVRNTEELYYSVDE